MEFNIQLTVSKHYEGPVKYALDKDGMKYLYVKHTSHKDHIHFYLRNVKGKNWPSAKNNVGNKILRACRKIMAPKLGQDVIIREAKKTILQWLKYMKHEDESTSPIVTGPVLSFHIS